MLPVAVVLAAAVEAVDKVRVVLAAWCLVAIKPRVRRSLAGIRPRVRHPIRPRAVEAEAERQLLRGSPVNPACLAMCRSNR